MTNPFTPDEEERNLSESWYLHAYSAEDGKTYWAIQRRDKFPYENFYSDVEAFHYCKQRAYEGSERHQRAINAHGDYV
jgi:hypothetical protein